MRSTNRFDLTSVRQMVILRELPLAIVCVSAVVWAERDYVKLLFLAVLMLQVVPVLFRSQTAELSPKQLKVTG
jgi:hypothetical protein